MKRIGVIAKTDRHDAPAVVERLLAWCADRGVQPVLEKETAGLCPDAQAFSDSGKARRTADTPRSRYDNDMGAA